MRNHDLILERKNVVLKPEDYEMIRAGDWVDILNINGQTVERCIRIDSVIPLTGRTRVQKKHNENPENLESYLISGRLALCPLYGKRLQRVVMQSRAD